MIYGVLVTSILFFLICTYAGGKYNGLSGIGGVTLLGSIAGIIISTCALIF